MGDDARGRITLRGIEAFVAVVDEGALGGAAARLGASPSTVSQQVTNLETALGARLVDRAARPFALTPAGRLFLARARRVLDEVARGRAELAAHGLADLQSLRLAVVEELDAEITPALAIALGDWLPRARIDCRTGASHANLALLGAREVDMAVAAESDTVGDGIESHALIREPYVLVTATGLVADGADVLDTLRAAPMIGYDAAMLMQRQIAAQFRRARFDAVPVARFETNHAALATVAGRRGWTVTTPLGLHRVPRLAEALEIRPLPFPGFARTLALHARRDVLGDLPARAAAHLRETIARDALAPMLARAPWLEGALRVAGPEPAV
ncbi:MAG: LysR family transcriptional regulator [Pseudomonadota bacterium]